MSVFLLKGYLLTAIPNILGESEILVTDTPHPRNSTLYRLAKQLLQKYHKKVRPVHDRTKATTVYLDVFVHAVLDVDAQNQKLKTSTWYYEVWDDEFLSWSPTMFDGIREISLPLSAIWAPDTSSVSCYSWVMSVAKVASELSFEAVITESIFARRHNAFPFDMQNCSLTFSSILHTVEDVDLAFLRSREDIKHDKKEFLKDSEWELLSVSSTYNILQSNTGDFAQIQFNVVIRRRPLVYVMSLLIPSIFLVLVDLGSFYLPPICRARIVFKTNVLVGYAVFRVNMSDEMPRSAVSTPLIGVFFTICLAFLVLGLFKSILLVTFLHDECSSEQEWPLSCLQGDIDADGPRRDPQAQPAGVTEPSVCREHQAQSETLKEVSFQLKSISTYFQTWDQEDRQEVKWLAFLERFDRLLFKACLVVLGLYAVSLCSLWALGSSL
ncbi:5-hydroxytryptamine receptor 3b [Lynx pardinus]|uniref:5-hydroxytryptamine receptor 3B n=1 Tax=Lynx pardinus TaxID=191816 RepID=A0A485N3L7_LYNPA|nr:5-hydroxytryptamine receptor 3b [Lynx pardinus]